MKIIFIILFYFSSVYAKYCFKDKSANEIICYKKYFDRDNIYKAKSDENYYTTKNDKIYAISDKIEIKFNTIGAIISLEKNFEIDFYDKLKNDTYIFKVRNPYELFSILSNLNSLDAIQKAVPAKTKKFTKDYIQMKIAKKKERLQKVINKSTNNEEKVGFQTGFTNIEKNDKQPTNFLKGGK
jgi:hypothetical protein